MVMRLYTTPHAETTQKQPQSKDAHSLIITCSPSSSTTPILHDYDAETHALTST